MRLANGVCSLRAHEPDAVRPRLRWACAWLALIAWLLAAPARAEWTWSADSTCLSRDAAAHAVADVLGGAVEKDIVVRASITGVAGAWGADLFVQRGEVSRTRSLTSEASACASLSDAVVVVTALLVDEVQAAGEPLVLTIPAPSAPPLEPPAAPPGVSWTGMIRLGSMARFDELPGLVGGPLLEVEALPPGGIPMLLSVGFWPPVETLREGRGGRFLGALVMLGVCPGVAIDASVGLAVGGCGALSLTYLFAEGLGAAQTRTAEGLSLGIEGRAFVRVRIAGPLWVHGGLGLFVPIVRPRASLSVGLSEVLVHEVAAVVPEGSLALELRFE
ncbi:MAG: hypothetical protein Q8L48_27700 [Archangium sp.]|nr:hypothetical protein [Archangium sp.]